MKPDDIVRLKDDKLDRECGVGIVKLKITNDYYRIAWEKDEIDSTELEKDVLVIGTYSKVWTLCNKIVGNKGKSCVSEDCTICPFKRAIREETCSLDRDRTHPIYNSANRNLLDKARNLANFLMKEYK